MNCGVYIIRNLITGEVYVGSSKNLEHRRRTHFNLLKAGRHTNKKLQTAFLKYGEEAFLFETVLFCLPEERFLKEELLIASFDSFWNGYNSTPNTRAINDGLKLSVSHRKLLSESAKRRYASEEARRATSRACAIAWKDPEFREKMLAKLQSPSVKKFRSEAQKSTWQDPIIRLRRISALQKICATTDYRNKISSANKGKRRTLVQRQNYSRAAILRYQNEEARAVTSAALQRPDTKADLSKKRKKTWKSKKYRKQISTSRRAMWADPSFRAMMSQKIKEGWERRKQAS